MEFISENKINAELVNSFDAEITLELAKMLEKDKYKTEFNGLKNLNLLRAPTINSLELTIDYTYLLDQELFDEN